MKVIVSTKISQKVTLTKKNKKNYSLDLALDLMENNIEVRDQAKKNKKKVNRTYSLPTQAKRCDCNGKRFLKKTK